MTPNLYDSFFSDKEQIGAKRRKKIPHFQDYFQGGGGGGPPGMGGAGGGGFGFPGLGFLPAAFMGFASTAGTSQSGGQGELNRFLYINLNITLLLTIVSLGNCLVNASFCTISIYLKWKLFIVIKVSKEYSAYML